MFGASWLIAVGVGNLVPLIGVLFLGWDLASILVMYWIETGIIGVINVLKIRKATAERPVTPGDASRGWLLAGLWLLSYGVFWLVLGPFVLQIANGGFYEGASNTGWTGASPSVVVWGTLSLAAGQVVFYVAEYVLGRRYQTVSSLQLLRDPFVRIFVIVATIAAGGIGIALARSPVGFVAAMVVAKTAVEIWFVRGAPEV
jgi:hypothetical protein